MSHHHPRVLFLLKLREDGYGCPYSYSDGLSSGLFNSARFVVEMLVAAGIEAKLAQVEDNNSIDREVHRFRPDVAIIEGLWVVPEKFEVLERLHPHVKWVVRIHSEIPFLAMEGVAMDWIAGYFERGVAVASNSDRCFRDLGNYARDLAPTFAMPVLLYLPNFYPLRDRWRHRPPESRHLRVGCFGAIRPLKNQLIQALAAVDYARRIAKPLRFYMTVRDCEQGGDQVLKNIRALFKHTGNELVECPWQGYGEFLDLLIHSGIDIGMAVSLSESFCIVAADMVSADIPVVVSPEIRWASFGAMSDPANTDAIAYRMGHVSGIFSEMVSKGNREGLHNYSRLAKRTWLDILNLLTA